MRNKKYLLNEYRIFEFKMPNLKQAHLEHISRINVLQKYARAIISVTYTIYFCINLSLLATEALTDKYS